MPSVRKKGKRLVGFFADEAEMAALHKAAELHGVTVADFLRGTIKPYMPEPTQPPKSSKPSAKRS